MKIFEKIIRGVIVMSEIYTEFADWLDNLLENNDMPENTVAYCFNLYEEDIKEHIYSIQLVGTDTFDENDGGDWACCEVWSSQEDIFCIDISDEDEKDRSHALEIFRSFAENYLETGKYKNILLKSGAVGMGFVDGDMNIIYKN